MTTLFVKKHYAAVRGFTFLKFPGLDRFRHSGKIHPDKTVVITSLDPLYKSDERPPFFLVIDDHNRFTRDGYQVFQDRLNILR